MGVVLWYVIPGVFLLSGVGLLIGGLVSGARTRAFLEKAIETRGEIVAFEEGPPAEAGAPATYRPVISYVPASGQRVRFKPMVYSNPQSFEVGERVVVLYEPDRPDEARIRSFSSLWLSSLMLLGLGTIFSVLGAWLLFGGIRL